MLIFDLINSPTAYTIKVEGFSKSEGIVRKKRRTRLLVVSWTSLMFGG
jgi:hypothetical protein